MNRLFFPVAFIAVLLGACSPAEYKVNPPPVAKEPVAEEVPESQKEGYMRIIGDLRWDELTSQEEWVNRFTECASDPRSEREYTSLWFKRCKEGFFKGGGISLYPQSVQFLGNPETESKTMTSLVQFIAYEESKRRALTSAIAQKYPLTTESTYCSKFTCWYWFDDSHDDGIYAMPTPYAISILDNVKVDKSDI